MFHSPTAIRSEFKTLSRYSQELGDHMNKIKNKPRLVSVLFLYVFIIFVLCMTSALAQSLECPVQYLDEHKPQRRALVIGNAVYAHHARVTSAATDASRVRDRLKDDLHFEVQGPLTVTTREEFSRALTDFRGTIGEGDLVVFYYSGHGFSYGADGFLAPTNLPKSVTEQELPDAAMAVDSVRYLLESRKPGMVIMILDACRTIGEFVIHSSTIITPASSSDSGTNGNGSSSASKVNLARRGLAQPRRGNGSVNTIVAFAAGQGDPADGNNTTDELSIYTRWLTTHIANEGQNFKTVLDETGADVSQNTAGDQNPNFSSFSYTNPFLRPTIHNLNEDKQAWCVALNTSQAEKIKRYTSRHSVTLHSAAARRWLKEQVVSGTRGYTFVSPVAVERAWQSLTDQVAIRRLETSAFAFPRSIDGSWENSVATATNTNLGVVEAGTTQKHLFEQKVGENYLATTWGIDSTTASDRKLAFSIASIDLHETVVTTINLVGRAEPNANAPLVSRIAKGTQLQVQGLAEGADNSVWLRAVTESILSPLFVKIDPSFLARRSVIELGESLKELVVNARPNRHPDLVDPEPLRAAVNELKNQGWEITWVSLATGAINKEEEQATRDARLDHAQYVLKQMGIPGVRMTSVTAVSDFKNDGVRVRIFGIRK